MGGSDDHAAKAAYAETMRITFWTLAWLVSNMSTAILNKAVFHERFGNFRFPLILSAIHLLVQSICTFIYVRVLGNVPRKSLDSQQQVLILIFAVLFGLNIILGNSSLRYVTVSFSRTVRSTIPLCTMVLSYVILRKRYTMRTQMAFIPLLLGVGLATVGEQDLPAIGFALSVVSVFFAALKAVLSNKYLTGSFKLHPLDLLDRTAPVALVALVPFLFVFGEASTLWDTWHEHTQVGTWTLIFSTAFAALALNYTSFKLSQITSALAVTVAGNAKEALTILVSVVVFRNAIAPLSLVGMVMVLLSSAWYSYLSMPSATKQPPTVIDLEKLPHPSKSHNVSSS